MFLGPSEPPLLRTRPKSVIFSVQKWSSPPCKWLAEIPHTPELTTLKQNPGKRPKLPFRAISDAFMDFAWEWSVRGYPKNIENQPTIYMGRRGILRVCLSLLVRATNNRAGSVLGILRQFLLLLGRKIVVESATKSTQAPCLGFPVSKKSKTGQFRIT